MCFEILGFDIMVKNDLSPMLIEVNHAPSFATETERISCSLLWLAFFAFLCVEFMVATTAASSVALCVATT